MTAMTDKETGVRTAFELLGLICKDTVTGFEGTVTAIVFYLGHATPRAELETLGPDNKPRAKWIDVARCEIVQPKG